MGVCDSNLGGGLHLDEEALHNQEYALKAKSPWGQDCLGGSGPQTPTTQEVQSPIDMSSTSEDELTPEGAEDSVESEGTLAEADREKIIEEADRSILDYVARLESSSQLEDSSVRDMGPPDVVHNPPKSDVTPVDPPGGHLLPCSHAGPPGAAIIQSRRQHLIQHANARRQAAQAAIR